MDGIDIGHFDFDRHNALYFFVINSDAQIYLRYGGRDSASATTYLDLESLELALRQGLEEHAKWKAAGSPTVQRSDRRYPRDIKLLQAAKIDSRHGGRRGRRRGGHCVECHQIADYEAEQLELDGKLDKVTTMYCSPDIKTLGIHLDVPRGLVIGEAKGAAAAAGLRKEDRILRIGSHKVLTFADLQYWYGKTPRDARQIQLAIVRTGEDDSDETLDLKLELPRLWWLTEIGYRNWSIDPLVYYKSRPLTEALKRKLELPVEGFASMVTWVSLRNPHHLEVGDITYAVDGVQTDKIANTSELYIKLRKRAGDPVKIDVLRNGEKIEASFRTRRKAFRK